ncbi:DUF6884 domain-containing protein [Kitasatospora aburaviensis]
MRDGERIRQCEASDRARPLRDDGWGPARAARRERRLASYVGDGTGLQLDGHGAARVRLELAGGPTRAAARAEAGCRFAAAFGTGAAAAGRVLTVEGDPEAVARTVAALPRLLDYTEQLATAAVRTFGAWTQHSSAAARLAAVDEAGLRTLVRQFRSEAFAAAAAVLAAPEDQTAAAEVDGTLAPWEQATAIATGIALYGWVDIREAFDPADVAALLSAATVSPEAFAEPAEQLELPLWDTDDQPAQDPVVVVIPCSGAKLGVPAEAGRIYTGALHTHARRTADALTASGGTVLVLSALHGLLTLDQVIEPYDHTWRDTGSITTERLREQAAALGLATATTVVLLTPSAYTQRALTVWPAARTPLAHLGIGQQRGRLTALRQHPDQYATAA